MLQIPKSYTNSKFYSYAGLPTQSRTYLNGCCPICREGNSWNKKKRLFYFFDDDYLHCHNCQKSWLPYFWIKEATGMSFKEMMKDIKDYTGYDASTFVEIGREHVSESTFQMPDLPGECVNLMDKTQLEYYKNYFIVTMARSYCEKRRLFTAVNAPRALYVCIRDNYHRNRLIIPYYGESNKIECYISRQLLDGDTKAKYLIKFNSNKPLFNIDKVDVDYPYIFIFEGAIDAMFVKNGVAISGVSMTADQEHDLNTRFPFHEKIWVFDNYRGESKEVRDKIKAKLKAGESVFLYGGEFADSKDMNDYCVKKNLNLVSPDLIVGGCCRGLEGLLALSA